jgi:hypothetical protein
VRLPFGDGTPSFFVDEKIDAIITNPPFGKKAEAFVRKASKATQSVRYMAFLLRSEWKHGSKRLDLFEPGSHYAGEIVLTWRPRWDWWFRDKPEASPRHNFSWFCVGSGACRAADATVRNEDEVINGPYPLRAVLRYEYVGASRYTGYVAKSIRLILVCGHDNYRKASQGAPSRARCRQCHH